jgi:hypothetical protein
MSLKDFHISTGKELLIIKDRVRNLINHWGEDGGYKEAVLKSVIKRYLPEKYRIATGFVVRQSGIKDEHTHSKQIDLLVYDTNFPVLFKEDDFVIVTSDSVVAIIEVKSNLQNADLIKVVKKANENGRFIYKGKYNKPKFFFNGIFSFDGYVGTKTSIETGKLAQSIIEANSSLAQDEEFFKYKVNHISFNEHLFFIQRDNSIPTPHQSMICDCPEMSFSYFISCLIDKICGETTVENANLWFANEDNKKILNIFI